jgi:hypothetical protein
MIGTEATKCTWGASETEPSTLLATSPEPEIVEVFPLLVFESLFLLPLLAEVQEFLQELLFILFCHSVLGCLLLVV